MAVPMATVGMIAVGVGVIAVLMGGMGMRGMAAVCVAVTMRDVGLPEGTEERVLQHGARCRR